MNRIRFLEAKLEFKKPVSDQDVQTDVIEPDPIQQKEESVRDTVTSIQKSSVRPTSSVKDSQKKRQDPN